MYSSQKKVPLKLHQWPWLRGRQRTRSLEGQRAEDVSGSVGHRVPFGVFIADMTKFIHLLEKWSLGTISYGIALFETGDPAAQALSIWCLYLKFITPVISMTIILNIFLAWTICGFLFL